MKKAYILLFVALACNIAQANDDNTFYFSDAAVMPGETTNIELCMRNKVSNLTCLEAEIQLPEGLAVVCDEKGFPVITLYSNRLVGHDILANVLKNGNLKLLVSSASNKLIGGKDGSLLSFCVEAAPTAPLGESVVQTVGESLLVCSNEGAYYSVGITGNVLITDDPTGINEELRMKNEESDVIYNLAGQRVSKAKSGIFIRGGKKEVHR